MGIKVYIHPTPKTIAADNGIGRVVHAQHKYLLRYGIELVSKPDRADIIAGHTQKFDLPRIDVLHLHGAYWTGDPGSGTYDQWHAGVNYQIAQAAREARAITVPSPWVGMFLRRDMRIHPVVIGHGIDLKEWKPGKRGDYVLWAKNRMGDVCDPTPALELAKLGVKVVSTYTPLGAQKPDTMTVTGKLPERLMRPMIAGADVYLSTVQETFGITTLEAMACGVPILGYDWGGTRDIVEHKVTGYLAEPGNVNGLMEGLSYIRNHRSQMSAAAIEAASRYAWPAMIEKYAQLYREVMEARETERNGVSVIITNYNYGHVITDAIDSVLNQMQQPDEVIIVDDGSTDDSLARLVDYAKNPLVKIVAQKNQGVAAARTAGIRAASQEFIVCLDADDRIEPEFIATLYPAILADRSLGIVYSKLKVVYPSGGVNANNDFPPEFNWIGQSTPHNPPSNYIPSACMFRKEMWRRSGPHKQEYAPGEDGEFWTRGLSIGYDAKRVTQEPLFVYYAHEKSASRTKQYRPIDDRLPWMRDHRFPFAAPVRDYMPEVRSYHHPMVSVVIPVGTGHARYVPDALDSLTGQTFREWEVILVDDTWTQNGGASYRSEITNEIATRYPFVEYAKTATHGKSLARNAGLAAARAPLVLFLDADDVLMPNALHEMVRAYSASGGKYIYSDVQILRREGAPEMREANDYQQMVWRDGGLHSVSALVPADWLREIGGFDESLSGLEDHDLFTRLAIAGYCGRRVPKPLLVYREYSGTQRKFNFARSPELTARIDEKYGEYLKGGKKMSSCCGGNGGALMLAKQFLDNMPQDANTSIDMQGAVASGNTTRMEYLGKQVGEITFFGLEGREYRGGNSSAFRYAEVNPADVDKLKHTGQWREVVVMPVADPLPMSPVEPEPRHEAIGIGLPAMQVTEKPRAEMTPEADAIMREMIAQQTAEDKFTVPPALKAKVKAKPKDKPKAKRGRPRGAVSQSMETAL